MAWAAITTVAVQEWRILSHNLQYHVEGIFGGSDQSLSLSQRVS
jgi:hypothetical protein